MCLFISLFVPFCCQCAGTGFANTAAVILVIEFLFCDVLPFVDLSIKSTLWDASTTKLLSIPQPAQHTARPVSRGLERIWTAIAGFRVQSANRYTKRPRDVIYFLLQHGYSGSVIRADASEGSDVFLFVLFLFIFISILFFCILYTFCSNNNSDLGRVKWVFVLFGFYCLKQMFWNNGLV